MLGKDTGQLALNDVGNLFPHALRPGSFHAQLAEAAPRLFDDEDFASLYAENIGRPSVPPSLLALVVLMQHEAGVSDAEAVERTGCDLRWSAVLRRGAGEVLCAKSTLQLFRSQLVVHEAAREVLRKSIEEARRAGLLKGNALRVAIDTKPMNGRGAVLDTVNLIAEAMRQVVRALSQKARVKPEDWMLSHGLSRYAQPSVKGEADIDWSDKGARRAFLGEIVADARRLLAEASAQGEEVHKASGLLSAILLQDVEEGQTQEGEACASMREGTAPGRIPSVSDPQQRHGHKSKSKLFTGHKSAIAVEEESAIITGVEVLAGDAADATGSLELVQQSEENTGLAAAQTVGDCAYGGGANRQSFIEDGRTLYAKVPQATEPKGQFPKQAFAVDLDNHTLTCPEGHVCSSYRDERDGGKTFVFGPVCAGCELRPFCTTSASGRSVHVHPQERLLQEARAFAESPAGRSVLRGRVVVEHRLARLAQLGIGQARYIGRRKSLYQLTIAAAIANLRRTWNWEATRSASDALAMPSDPPCGALAAAMVRVWRAVAGRFRATRRCAGVCLAA
jgi:hypothetical protein